MPLLGELPRNVISVAYESLLSPKDFRVGPQACRKWVLYLTLPQAEFLPQGFLFPPPVQHDNSNKAAVTELPFATPGLSVGPRWPHSLEWPGYTPLVSRPIRLQGGTLTAQLMGTNTDSLVSCLASCL